MALVLPPPLPAYVRRFEVLDSPLPQGKEGLQMQDIQREAYKSIRTPNDLTESESLCDDDASYSRPPLRIIGTIKVRYGTPSPLKPRRIKFDD